MAKAGFSREDFPHEFIPTRKNVTAHAPIILRLCIDIVLDYMPIRNPGKNGRRVAKSFVVPPLGGNCGLRPAKAGTTNDFAVVLGKRGGTLGRGRGRPGSQRRFSLLY